MLMLKKVAITGGLACGKSSVCQIFRELGAYVVSADEIVHQLLSPKTSLGQQVIALLGSDIIVNDQIDRSRIAKKVFNDKALLRSLEQILHPAVQAEIEKNYQKAKEEGKARLFIAEIPLLFEGRSGKTFDATITVIADRETSMKRFMASTGYDKEEYNRRMEQQLPIEEKIRRADYVINNQDTLQQLRQMVGELYQSLVSTN